MSKERVQAKLAFNGCLKPVEKVKRAQTSKDTEKATLNGQQRQEGGENAAGKIGTEGKRKRGALQAGPSTSAGVGCSAKQDDPPGMQPATMHKRETKRFKKSAVEQKQACEEKPAKPNPVFALAARRCVAEANKSVRSRSALVDVTTPVKKQPQPDIAPRTCDISTSLPPVHMLQGFSFSSLQKRPQNGPLRLFCGPAGAAGAALEDSLQAHLQHESKVCSVTTEVSKLLNDSIADFLWADAAAAGPACPHNATTGGCWAIGSSSAPAPPDSPIAYVQTVLSHAGFQVYAHDPSTAVRWQKQMACMMGNAEDFSAEQLPWTAKYAPQATDQLLSNASACTQMRQWLSRERTEKSIPTETESFAVSSWKADSEDSDFVDSKASKRFNGPGGMLVTGPHGTGKSAAVHACAQELHMNVLEISPGMDRSGNNLVKLVGEATQSHTVICKGMPLEEINQPNQEDLTTCKHKGRPAKSKASKKKPTKQTKPAKNVGPPQPEQRCLAGAPPSGAVQGKEQSVTRSRSLLLFEDFDQLLDNEDDGFLASLSTLLLESKIPVFLLSERPDAEELLQRAVAAGAKLQSAKLCAPPLRSLLEYVALVCACERVPVLPSTLMQLTCACYGDLRSALNQLQILVDHCSMKVLGPIEIDGPEEQSWKGCAWASAALSLAAPVPLSALHRAQPWQAQPHSMLWGLHEPQGSAIRADPFSMDCSATEWACLLLVETASGRCAKHKLASGVVLCESQSVGEQDQQTCDQIDHQQNAAGVLAEGHSEPAGSGKQPSGPQGSCTAQFMSSACASQANMKQCEREGGRILAAWAEYLRVKQSSTLKRRKRRRNAAVNGAQQGEGGEGRKKSRVLQGQDGAENQENPGTVDGMAEDQENPVAAHSLVDSVALELQDGLPEDDAEAAPVGRSAAAQQVLDDDAAEACAMHIDDQTRPSGLVMQVHDPTNNGEARAEGALPHGVDTNVTDNVHQSYSATIEVPAGASLPSEIVADPEYGAVEGVSTLGEVSASDVVTGGSAAGAVQQPVQLNAAALVMKQAEAAQKLYLARLQELAVEMQACNGDNADVDQGNAPVLSSAPASVQSEPTATASGAIADLQAAVQAAETASAVEALAGRRLAMLDRCIDCISTTEWLWNDASAEGVAVPALPKGVSAYGLPKAATPVGAGSKSTDIAMGMRDGVDAAALDAVLEGIHECACACYTGRVADVSLLPMVQSSVPFRRGTRLLATNVVRAMRPVLQCGTRSAAVHCARAAITMASEEYTVVDEQEDSGARRSRRQRQRGYCEDLFHKFDFNLSQFSDAQLSTLSPV